MKDPIWDKIKDKVKNKMQDNILKYNTNNMKEINTMKDPIEFMKWKTHYKIIWKTQYKIIWKTQKRTKDERKDKIKLR